ncbi:hypothetical protein ONE63_002528 [Megalurothrips usitatus]|uniref:Uncharacterized protein n=1 Tax=Megalurothrips usitatus TaxID=439358 RepID=A0AAV7X8F4_9NEOP|nr:hypothetical protein ONE63_002528 [Megalurothrips usitatus]
MWCQSIYCDPPKRCYNISVGERCCEHTCLDDPSVRWPSRRGGSSGLTVGLATLVSALAVSLAWTQRTLGPNPTPPLT